MVSHLPASQIVSPSNGREQEAWPVSPALGHLRNRKELRRETGRGCKQVVYGCLLSVGKYADFIRHERNANRRSWEIFSSVGWAETEGSHETLRRQKVGAAGRISSPRGAQGTGGGRENATNIKWVEAGNAAKHLAIHEAARIWLRRQYC